ncbi:3-hydroxyacyl-CoA dehydrogenase family protein [Aquabacter sp. L1I39]|uniref:3-hydroxyacyl-CoA dehydrogenase family protein n=1 Tax=Aquabacter sp. L1I39 TaxID=2820278 RepID=UPI001ADAF245|nr:3-hydroxyacyl-CoA dehydrogenase family protein [Aquabacter sp. L1I39]QTL03070.1 3-hydroxyacyl-CoA dehydrogenase family protein [Aquabacter sp. L1I39]
MTEKITIGVAGAGTMGTGIAIVAARGGFPTLLFDLDPARVEAALGQMRAFFGKSVQRGKLTQAEVDEILSRVRGTSTLDDMAACGLVIEAIFEELDAKGQLFSALNGVCPPETLFASNTSTLSITEIAARSGRDDRFVGMHFCLPAQLMKLVEMSPGLNTSDESFARAWALCEAMGQRPVKTQDAPGFILNAFLVPFNNDAIRLVEQGVAEPAEIDAAIKGALGYAMGPMELLDLVGLDTQVLLCEALHGVTHEPRAACPPLLRRMVAARRLGRKTQRGFLDYQTSAIFGA